MRVAIYSMTHLSYDDCIVTEYDRAEISNWTHLGDCCMTPRIAITFDVCKRVTASGTLPVSSYVSTIQPTLQGVCIQLRSSDGCH